MTRMTAKDFAPTPAALRRLRHGRITKREFLDRAAKFAVGAMTAPAILAA
jgi:carboxymethylenebutenolidase